MYKFLVLAAFAAFVSGASIKKAPWSQGGRIVGGEDADIEDFPYQISIHTYGSHNCGGSIISKDWIVTAGHCASDPTSAYGIYVGSSRHNSGGVLYKVSKVIRHPRYGTNAWGNPVNDIALMKVSRPFKFNGKCQAIELFDPQEETEEGTTGYISGWGKTDAGNHNIPTILQFAAVPIISKQDCDDAYSNIGGLPENQICAAYPQGGVDSCQGDSGGPMAIGGRLAGVTSWGVGCGEPGKPGAYTEVAAYRKWIKQQIGV